MSQLVETAVSLFKRTFGYDPTAAGRAPGRVEVIGNHTDYNGGMVIGAGIDREIVAVGAPRTDKRIRLASAGGNERVVESGLDSLVPRSGGDRWINYPIGVVVMLREEGIRIDRGFDIVFVSNVPTGAGLSSSAALELSTAELLLTLNDATMEASKLVRTCRRAENEFVGVPSGILDQGVSKFSRAGYLVSIDCRDEVFSTVPLPPDTHFWIFNSHQKHALLSSLYADRHRECMQAREVLKARQDITFLTDADPDLVEASREELGDVLYRRALHVTTEHRRVSEALAALRDGDRARLGGLLHASHESSRDFFENSTPELDYLVERLSKMPHVIGARLTGGGFGGAVLALTDAAFSADDAQLVSDSYRSRFGSRVDVLHCLTIDGASAASIVPAPDISAHS